MSNRRIRIVGPAALANADALLYTVPAGTRLTIRHIHIENPTAAPVGVTLGIGADALGTRLYDAYSIAAAAAGQPASVLDVFCFYVLEAAETLRGHASAAASLVATIDGELELIS